MFVPQQTHSGQCLAWRAQGHSALLKDIQDRANTEGHGLLDVWMSHGDKVTALPPGFKLMASTPSCPIAGIADILERVAPLFAIMRVAAKTEPEIAEVLKVRLGQRLRNLTAVAQRLATQKALREGLNAEQAADIIWTITSPEVFSLLTVDRGWSKERYVQWLGDALARLLLP